MATSIYLRNGSIAGSITQIDDYPIENSDNLVRSKGLYEVTEQDKSVFEAKTNLIDKAKVVSGQINRTTGNIDQSATYHVTDFIAVDTTQVYLSPKCNLMAGYNEEKEFIAAVNAPPYTRYNSGAVSFPEGTKFVRLQIIADGVENAIFVQAKYYDGNPVCKTIPVGFSDNFKEALRIEDGVKYSQGINLFDYKHDFYQVASGLRNGMNNTNGEINYRYEIITSDDEISGYFTVTMDKFYPIVSGQMIVSNKSFCDVAFYDSNKTFLTCVYVSSSYPYHALVAPQNTAYARISFRGNPSNSGEINSLEDIKDIVVWVINAVGSNDLIPNVLSPQPHNLIDGQVISPNYLDKVVPSMDESTFLSAMKCMTIREINKRDHALRFGNFNMWVMENTKGWNMTKKMLMDYGVDFCGFEECVVNESTSMHKGIAEFLHGWQFPSGFYENWTDGDDAIDKSFVSRYDVIESTKLSFPSATSNVTYLNCKVRLPRYMDVYNPTRILSVYVVHFPIAQSQEKIAVANDLLSQIALDNSDFIVILGDTNDFGATQETKEYWETIKNGGFNPVLPYNIKTVTQDNGEGATEQEPDRWWKTRAIDQFFVSDNITAINYGIKNTKEDYAIPDSALSPNTDNVPALSDHDFVYCDLKFDYSRLRTIVPVT